MAGEDFGAVEQPADFGGDPDLTGLASQRRNARVERLDAAFERIDRQRSGGEGGAEHPLGHEHSVERDGGRGLGAVDQGEALLGAELERLHAEPVERVAGGEDFALEVDPPLAHHRGDEVGERGEVARCADAALARDERHGVPVEQALERVDHQRANTGKSATEAEQLQDNHQPNDMARQCVAEPAAVRQDQVALQLGQAVGCDAGAGEQAEAGVDAVNRLAAGDDAVDRSGGDANAGEAGVVEAGGSAGPQLAQGGEVDGFGIQ